MDHGDPRTYAELLAEALAAEPVEVPWLDGESLLAWLAQSLVEAEARK